MIVVRGDIYLEDGHEEALRNEPGYVRERYKAVARTLAPEPFGVTRKTAAGMIGRSLRQLYRIIGRFLKEGMTGLRFRSKRPKNSPNKTPDYIENQVSAVRDATGFGSKPVSDIVNESRRREGNPKMLYPSLTYNIMVRKGYIEQEKRIQTEWKHFEWGHPNRLIQADLTDFNGIPILTMEDDHARKGWSVTLPDKKDTTVTVGMRRLVSIKYDNLLTDNGSQFSRKNAVIREYCELCINEKHIWSSIHHPQTLGKLSAYQKGLKRFLRHKLGLSQDRAEIDKWIIVYNDWYNNGRYHFAISMVPEERYSGHRDENWYVRLVKVFKLENVLTIIPQRGDISP